MIVLVYADDLVLMDKSHNGLKSLISRLKKEAKKVGLQINEDKTEGMVVEKWHSVDMFSSLKIDNYELKRAKQFKYLGWILTENNEIDKEIASRIYRI